MSIKGRKVVITAGAGALIVLVLAVWLGWPHLVFLYRFERLGTNAQGYAEYGHRRTGIIFVRLPGGTFFMGAQASDPDGPNHDPDAMDNERPVHEVKVSPFLIAKHEVTQARWQEAMGTKGMIPQPKGPRAAEDDRPVNVSWEAVQEFEAKTGLTLPTEAEWEYACRAVTSTPYSGTGNLEDMGWYRGNGGGAAHPVGEKAPNGFGLHDAHGNVWELCEDIYDEHFYEKPEARGTDPLATEGSGNRVIRGGYWGDGAGCCRSADRGGIAPAYAGDGIGFRPTYPWP
jgi:formylglycine-generating enzyme required for sulfatase activity